LYNIYYILLMGSVDVWFWGMLIILWYKNREKT